MVSLVSESLAKERLNLEARRWKAFLRMTGETTVDTEQDILTEFKVMADYMKCIGVNYSMIVHVEAGRTAQSNTVVWSSPPVSEERRTVGDQ